MIRKIDSNIFSLTILKVTTFSRIRQESGCHERNTRKVRVKKCIHTMKVRVKKCMHAMKVRVKKCWKHLEDRVKKCIFATDRAV